MWKLSTAPSDGGLSTKNSAACIILIPWAKRRKMWRDNGKFPAKRRTSLHSPARKNILRLWKKDYGRKKWRRWKYWVEERRKFILKKMNTRARPRPKNWLR